MSTARRKPDTQTLDLVITSRDHDIYGKEPLDYDTWRHACDFTYYSWPTDEEAEAAQRYAHARCNGKLSRQPVEFRIPRAEIEARLPRPAAG